MAKNRNDLSSNAKKTSIGVLQACLTDSIDLYNGTRQAHWNVRGSNFRSLHLMFEEFYTTLATDIDEVAERLVQLGGTANGTSQSVAAATRLAPFPTDMHDGTKLLQAMLERYTAVAKSLREGIDATDEAGDADTADLLTGISRNVDKAVWMMEATADV